MDIEKEPLYEGKSKALYEIKTSKDKLLMRFKDDITAFNNKKHDIINGKGSLNNKICSRIFEYLRKNNISTHYVMRTSDTDMVVHKTKVIPIEVVVRNNIAGGLAKRFGIEDRIGELIIRSDLNDLDTPILELYYKSDELGDPLMIEEHALSLEIATSTQLTTIKNKAMRINILLKKFFSDIGITIADFKLEFGIDDTESILLVDDICPDGCRLWDKFTGNSLDKDNYRFGRGDINRSYKEVYDRIIAVHEKGIDIKSFMKRKLFLELEEIYKSFDAGLLDGLYWDVEQVETDDYVGEPAVVLYKDSCVLKDVDYFEIQTNLKILKFRRVEEYGF